MNDHLSLPRPAPPLPQVHRGAIAGRIVALTLCMCLAQFASAKAPSAGPTAPNLARQAEVTASFDKTGGYEPRTVNDGDFDTRWDSGKGDASWLELSWKQPITFDRVVLVEWNRHVRRVTMHATQAGGTLALGEARTPEGATPESSCARTWTLHTGAPITTDRLRIDLTGTSVSVFEVRVALSGSTGMRIQRGQVRDRRSGRPLPGVVVRALPWGEACRTDAQGRYALELEPGTYPLEADASVVGQAAANAAPTLPRPARVLPDRAYNTHTERRTDTAWAPCRVTNVPAGSPRNLALDPVTVTRLTLTGTVPNAAFPPDRTCTVPIGFDLPRGTRRLELRLDDLQPAVGARTGNAIDYFYRWAHFVLFDPRGTGAERFRGLGFSRNGNGAFVTPDEATPGWIAGPLTPGRWTLLAYCGSDTVDMRYHLTLTIFSETDKRIPTHTASPPRYDPGVLNPWPGWYKGDFHNHCTHSADASQSLAALLADRAAQGWDWLTLTDHNTVSGHAEVARIHGRKRPLVLLGEEITTEFGHFNAWGIPQGMWCDFRFSPATPEALARVIDAVHAAGGGIGLNHPGYPVLPPKGFDWNEKLDNAEVWNGTDEATLVRRLAWVDAMYAKGLRVPIRGGSDLHHPGPLHTPITYIHARALSRDALMEGIRAGHMTVTRDARAPRLVLEADPDDDGTFRAEGGDTVHTTGALRCRARVEGGSGAMLRVITARGVEQTTAVTAPRQAITFEVRDTPFVRVELMEVVCGRHVAITNPVYVKR